MRSVEFGSYFDGRPYPRRSEEEEGRTPSLGLLCGTGRHSIALAMEGLGRRGVDVLRTPAYFCPEVVEWLSERFRVKPYDCAPFDAPSELFLSPNEAVLLVEYFGMRATVSPIGGAVLVDRTHAPWADHEYARTDAIVGSLRKAVPVPDGGFVQFASETLLPRLYTNRHSAEMYGAMNEKYQWLVNSGRLSEKNQWLSRLRAADRMIGQAEPCEIGKASTTILGNISFSSLAAQRASNVAHLFELIRGRLRSASAVRTPAFLILSSVSGTSRDSLIDRLAARDVYGAVLWRLKSGASPRHTSLSEKMITIHADYRYSANDIADLATRILGADEEVAFA